MTLHNLLFIGWGSVAKATIVMWQHILPERKINELIIIDPYEPVEMPENSTTYFSLHHYPYALTQNNYQQVMNEVTSKHPIDLILDLSVYVDGVAMVKWALQSGIPYVNTALETWPSQEEWDGTGNDIMKHTLYKYQRDIYGLPGSTAIVDHGMNPGLISHFAKFGLLKYAQTIQYPSRELIEAIACENYPRLANLLNLRTIHCSERDTQRSYLPEVPTTFYCTWSCIGLGEEGEECLQMGLGTHEIIPDNATFPDAPFPGRSEPHQMFVLERGMNVKVQSYEPMGGEMEGYCISHSEASTLTNFLTDEADGQYYRPSMYYVYLPCPAAERSLDRMRENGYKMLNDYLVYSSREIIDGADSVGCLFMYENDGQINSYWAGSIIDNDTALKYSRDINATGLQVSAGICSAADYALDHPDEGVLWPESLDSHRVFELTQRFLGKVVFSHVPFSPPSAAFVDLVSEIIQ